MNRTSYFQVRCPHCGALTDVKVGKRTSCRHCQCEIVFDASDLAVELMLCHKLRLQSIQNILCTALESNGEPDIWKQIIVEQLATVPPAPNLFEIPVKPEFIEPASEAYIDFPPEPQPGTVPVARFEKAYAKWAENVKRIEAENERRYERNVGTINDWNKQSKKREQDIAAWQERFQKVEEENFKRTNEHAAALERWQTEKHKVEESVKSAKINYETQTSEAIEFYCKLVLQFSNLPDGFRREFDLEYVPETKNLIIDHALPAPDNLSRVKELKFVESRQEFVEVSLSDREFDGIYDSALYQTCLRTIHELFHADKVNALDAVVFNGWIESVDKATGNDTKACVMSVHVKKEELQKINLARVDPKACFNPDYAIG